MIDVLEEKWVSMALVVGFVVAWTLLFFFLSPEELVASLGVQQVYAVVFLLSVLGALLSMTTFSTYPAIVAFALGGMSFVGLVATAGLGLTLGDRIFYSLGTRVKKLLSGRPERWAVRLEEWLEARPRWQITGVTYVWVGLLPLANNVLTGALALGGYRFRDVLMPIFLGNVTFPAAVAWLATQGIELYG